MRRIIIIYIVLFCLLLSSLSACDAHDSNVSCEFTESSESSEYQAEYIDNEDLFKEKFGYYLDIYELLDSNSEDYRIFIDNPIDSWAREFRSDAKFSYTDISSGENIIWQNWKNNISLSLSYLQTCVSGDNYIIVEEWTNSEIDLIVNERKMTDALIREMTFPGTLQFVGELVESNEQIKRIAFKLKYFEIIAQNYAKENNPDYVEKDLSFVFDENA